MDGDHRPELPRCTWVKATRLVRPLRNRRRCKARIDPRDRADRWRDHLAGGSSITLVAELDGRPIGFVNFGACRDEDVLPEAVGEVMAIYVRPEAWGTGIGEALMREALAQLRGSYSVEVVLWVIEWNRRAVGFYERLGFRPDGSVRLREMYGTPTSIVRLRRRLEDSA